MKVLSWTWPTLSISQHRCLFCCKSPWHMLLFSKFVLKVLNLQINGLILKWGIPSWIAMFNHVHGTYAHKPSQQYNSTYINIIKPWNLEVFPNFFGTHSSQPTWLYGLSSMLHLVRLVLALHLLRIGVYFGMGCKTAPTWVCRTAWGARLPALPPAPDLVANKDNIKTWTWNNWRKMQWKYLNISMIFMNLPAITLSQ